ncbi:MAG: hypothetical protein AAGA81_04615 [Acidobacteriota bacterium]
MLTCRGFEPSERAAAAREERGLREPARAYREARRLVVILLASKLEERHAAASARLLPIAARLANAALTPRQRLATPHLLRLLLCLDELEAAGRIDIDLAGELWRAAARVHRALQGEYGGLS